MFNLNDYLDGIIRKLGDEINSKAESKAKSEKKEQGLLALEQAANSTGNSNIKKYVKESEINKVLQLSPEYKEVRDVLMRDNRSFIKDVGTAAENLIEKFTTQVNNNANPNSGSGSSSKVNAIPSTTYIDAPLAQQYGMDAYTAYQEALSNTSMQRSMLDYQRAGLNPILASGYSGAGSFTPNVTEISGNSASSVSSKADSALPALVGLVFGIASKSSFVGNAAKDIAESLLR